MAQPGAIPERFRAFVAEKLDDGVARGVRELAATDLPDGEVDVRVAWSSVNYKDGLATIPTGKVARISPLVPGIDLAGTVVASRSRDIAVGAEVIAHGYELGVSRHGGFAEYARVHVGRPAAERATRAWAQAHGVALLDLKALVAEHVLSGRGNPDGMHWGWSAHAEVGRACAALLCSERIG